MKCPELWGSRILSCGVNGFVYMPSLLELEEYCKTSRHDSCPHIQHHAQAGEVGHLTHKRAHLINKLNGTVYIKNNENSIKNVV